MNSQETRKKLCNTFYTVNVQVIVRGRRRRRRRRRIKHPSLPQMINTIKGPLLFLSRSKSRRQPKRTNSFFSKPG
jgi:hypothetical protein